MSQKRFTHERLEPRIALDGVLGSAWQALADNSLGEAPNLTRAVPVDSSPPKLTQFTTAADLRQHLIDAALAQYAGLFGRSAWDWRLWQDAWLSGLEDAVPIADGTTALPGGTNVQVDGVDEGDFVKTDGKYLYQLVDRELLIIDIQDPTQLRITARLATGPSATPREIYVIDDRLTIISESPGLFVSDIVSQARIAANDALGFWQPAFEPTIEVAVYDIRDRTAPRLLETSSLDGTLLETRAIGNFVYLVTQDWADLPAPKIECSEEGTPNDPPGIPDQWRLPLLNLLADGTDPGLDLPRVAPPQHPQCVYESRDAYVARLVELPLDGWLPEMRVLDGAHNEIAQGLLVQPTAFHEVAGELGLNIVTILAMDVADDLPGPDNSAAVLQDGASEVYASQSHLFLGNLKWNSDSVATTLTQFQLTGAEVLPAAIGAVPGQLLNQFAMDEYQGFLRVATTRGWGDAATNQLYVLRARDGLLEVVGQLSKDLAPGERLFAARFLGDQAFLSTFRQIDPLFTIDLSDPTSPEVVGELQIPGFSLYLHPVAPGYLVGLGRDADVESGRQLEPQLTLFDVSDPSSPRAAATFLFAQDGHGWSHSEAFWNHHAISYFPQYQTLVVPLESSGWQPWDGLIGMNDVMPWKPRYDFWVLQIDTAADAEAIRLRGTIAHDSPARRSLEVAGNLFTVATDDVQVHPILDPSTLIDQLPVVRRTVDDGVPLVKFRLEPTDLDGNPLVMIEVGQEFLLNIFVQDLRAEGTGVFGGYLDAHFDADLTAVAGPIAHGTNYSNGIAGSVDIAGMVDEIGGFASFERLGSGELLLAQVPFVANAVGQLVFTADAADELPAHDVTIYDVNLPVAHSAIEFLGATLNIVDGFHNRTLSTDTNGDGNTSALDALVVVNFLNRHGTQSIVALRELPLDVPAGEGTARQLGVNYFYLDVNSDGYVSPIDVLGVINLLNVSGTTAPEGEDPRVLAWPRWETAPPGVIADNDELAAGDEEPANSPDVRPALTEAVDCLDVAGSVSSAADGSDSLLDEIAQTGRLLPDCGHESLFGELWANFAD
jgi:hypothetical protein